MNLPYISKPNEIPNEEYHRGDLYSEFISSTSLKHYLISPKYYRWAKDNPHSIGVEAALTGSVYHEMLASITNKGDLSDFESNFVVFDPPVNPKTGSPYGYNTKAWEEAYNDVLLKNPGIEVCTQVEVDLANTMIEQLLSGDSQKSRDILHLIKHGEAEVSHFIEYEGAKYKYRTDLKTSKKIVDWKTTRFGVAHPDEFGKQIINMGYHISAAMYQFMEYLATGVWKKFYWVAQEKEAPYDFMIYDSEPWTWVIHKDDDMVEPMLGGHILLRLLELHSYCLENNEYPGYEVFVRPDWKNHRIAETPVPGYAKNKDFNYYPLKK